jgi:hypothetical protein
MGRRSTIELRRLTRLQLFPRRLILEGARLSSMMVRAARILQLITQEMADDDTASSETSVRRVGAPRPTLELPVGHRVGLRLRARRCQPLDERCWMHGQAPCSTNGARLAAARRIERASGSSGCIAPPELVPVVTSVTDSASHAFAHCDAHCGSARCSVL